MAAIRNVGNTQRGLIKFPIKPIIVWQSRGLSVNMPVLWMSGESSATGSHNRCKPYLYLCVVLLLITLYQTYCTMILCLSALTKKINKIQLLHCTATLNATRLIKTLTLLPTVCSFSIPPFTVVLFVV